MPHRLRPILNAMGIWACALSLVALPTLALAASAELPQEPHHRLSLSADHPHDVALTLDACMGAYDADLIALLVKQQVPATLFVTKRWLDRNPGPARELLAHPELFELQDHGAAHVPAVVGKGRKVYGIAGQPDMAHVEQEVQGGAQAIQHLSGHAPTYYRGATAVYDPSAEHAIQALGYQIAGFSVNADAGATLPKADIVARLRATRPGDIIIAHMNRPAGQTAEALAQVLPELLGRGLHFVKLSQAQITLVSATAVRATVAASRPAAKAAAKAASQPVAVPASVPAPRPASYPASAP